MNATNCCEFTSCVDSKGGCWQVNNYVPDLNPGGNDNDAACVNYNGMPSWYDCDSTPGLPICAPICGRGHGNFVYAGELNVGEYPDMNTPGCCGDDPNEYARPAGFFEDPGNVVCCNSPNDCIDTTMYPYNFKCLDEGTPKGNLKCYGGDWRTPKLTWDGTDEYYCNVNSQCLVDRFGDPLLDNMPETWYLSNSSGTRPRCIANGQYILDHLCDNGKWTTRSRNLASVLINDPIGGQSDYTLFCDNYTDTLNYYSYYLKGVLSADMLLAANAACGTYPCFNDFCVLLTGDGVLRSVGSSINPVNNYTNLSLVAAIFNISTLACPNNPASDVFYDCGSSGVKYNAHSNIFLYVLPGKMSQIEGTNFMARFLRFIKAPFDSLLVQYKQANPADTGANKYNDIVIPEFNRLYIMKKGAKGIYAVQERLNITDRAMLNYTGFTTDICAVVTPSIPANSGTCSKTGSNNIILVNRNSGEENKIFDMWPELTSALRIS